jgi:hypothetical protein
MKKFIFVALSLALVSCSFKGKDQPSGTAGGSTSSTTELKIDPNGDSDGDRAKDLEEVNRGSNPFVADLPDLKVKFLQNYKIEVFYHAKSGDPVADQKSFTINTDVKDTNPDFKFRVGNIFARDNALKKAASFARFPNHTKGVIEDRDLSWVSYPELDPRFFHENSLKYQNIFSGENIIDNIKITISNQVKLNESPFFKEIKDLKLNYYFLNHETENYEVLSSVSVDRHFQTGIFETFETVIENVPASLVKDSFFRRGEFIISEIDDYQIPALEVNYKTLLAKVRAKSIPVLFETPLEERLYYVAAGGNGISFQELLKSVFDKNYEVKDDSLIKIKEFQNNLPEFTYLSEVSDKDKLGRWFVMTNEFKDHYLDHRYTANDRIVLSYNVGSELADQKNEHFFAFEPTISSNRNEIVMALGTATARSQIDFQLNPISRFGRSITNEKIRWETPSSCGKNCFPKQMVCHWDVNKYSDYSDALTLTPDLSGEGEKLYLVLDNDEYKITDLLKEKKVSIYRVGNKSHVKIENLSKIKEIKPFDEVNVSLKLKAYIGSGFFGVKLVGVEGDWRGLGGCPFNTPGVAESRGTHISKDTNELGEISWLVNDLANRGYAYKFQLIDSGPYYQEISLGVSSTIENFYN